MIWIQRIFSQGKQPAAYISSDTKKSMALAANASAKAESNGKPIYQRNI